LALIPAPALALSPAWVLALRLSLVLALTQVRTQPARRCVPVPAGVCEAAFLRIGEEPGLGERSVDAAVKQFFTESKAALSS
jgi:hypothetical protein